MIEDGCQCFLYRHRDEPRLVKAYCLGYKEACEVFLKWSEKQKMDYASIIENHIGGISERIVWNYLENEFYIDSLPNIEV